MINDLKSNNLTTNLLCKTLKVSRSTYYSQQSRPESARLKSNKILCTKIKLIHSQSKETYGYPRITKQLQKDGEICGPKRVLRLMKLEGLQGVARKRYRVYRPTVNLKKLWPERIFKTEDKSTFPAVKNKIWVTDITYIPTKEGWLYLAVFLDLKTREVVGYSMGQNQKSGLILQALNMALLNKNPTCTDLVIHSDRGSQYRSDVLQNRLSLLGITPSMSRSGNCYDNAYAETFFHSLKVELVNREKFKTRKEAKAKIFNYIEIWYNTKRLHSSLDFMSPVEYQQKQNQLITERSVYAETG